MAQQRCIRYFENNDYVAIPRGPGWYVCRGDESKLIAGPFDTDDDAYKWIRMLIEQ